MSKRPYALEVRALGKRYPATWQGPVRAHEALERAMRSPLRMLRSAVLGEGRSTGGHTWVLRNVSFNVAPGEILGVVGRNGAGKSVLLRILSRVTRPTEGSVTLRGSVAPLLEVGAGFHHELSGRDNIFLNGTILGMRLDDIAGRVEQIVDFAGVGDVLDAPVKTYSSGMRMRLAFAVAAHLDRDIYLLDEVLAVGDEAFQKRCLDRVGELASSGKTILLVNHSPDVIAEFCSRALLLDKGTLLGSGKPKSIIARYHNLG